MKVEYLRDSESNYNSRIIFILIHQTFIVKIMSSHKYFMSTNSPCFVYLVKCTWIYVEAEITWMVGILIVAFYDKCECFHYWVSINIGIFFLNIWSVCMHLIKMNRFGLSLDNVQKIFSWESAAHDRLILACKI